MIKVSLSLRRCDVVCGFWR